MIKINKPELNNLNPETPYLHDTDNPYKKGHEASRHTYEYYHHHDFDHTGIGADLL